MRFARCVVCLFFVRFDMTTRNVDTFDGDRAECGTTSCRAFSCTVWVGCHPRLNGFSWHFTLNAKSIPGWFSVARQEIAHTMVFVCLLVCSFVCLFVCCLFCSCVFFSVLMALFKCISLHKLSQQISAFLLFSSGFISALLDLSTIHLFMKVSFSPDTIPFGWLGSKRQLIN